MLRHAAQELEVATAAAARAETLGGPDGHCAVTVPGGRLEVTLDDGRAELIGPAVIIARGEVLVPDPRTR